MTDSKADMNTTPAEATYQLLTAPHRPLHPVMTRETDESRFVHFTVDNVRSPLAVNSDATTQNSTNIPSADGADGSSLKLSEPLVADDHAKVAGTGTNASSENIANLTNESDTAGPRDTGAPTAPRLGKDKDKKEDEDEDEDEKEEEEPNSHKRGIANTRNADASDGILGVAELVGNAQETLTSAYGSNDWAGGDGETFEKRGGFERLGEDVDGLVGGREPGYTCFSPLFQLTLGIFRFLLLVEFAQANGSYVTRLLVPP